MSGRVNSQLNNKNQDVASSSIYYSRKYFQIKDPVITILNQ